MNKAKSSLIVVITLVMLCCVQPQGYKEHEKNAYDIDFRSVLEPYCLLDHELDTLSLADINTIFFLKEARWDTSFWLVLRKDTASISGVYREVTPASEGASYKTGVTFYDGFSFSTSTNFQNEIITDSLWNIIIAETQPLLDTVYHVWDLDCCDRSRYLLSHGSKFTSNKSFKNEDALEKYAQFLRRALIYPVYRKKKEFDSRPNPNN